MPPVRAEPVKSEDHLVFRRRFSPLMLRILAVNVLALGILLGGMLYLGQYENGLIESELQALATQGRIFAGTLAEGALVYGTEETDRLSPEIAELMVRRLVEATESRTRLFDAGGEMIAESRDMLGTSGAIEVVELPPPPDNHLSWLLDEFYAALARTLPDRTGRPEYKEPPDQTAFDFPDAARALKGETASMIWTAEQGGLVLTVAVPIQRLRQVLGVVYLSRPSDDIDAAVRSVRLDILRVFAVALAITILMSVWLANTIAQPIRRLAQAAERVRRAQGRLQHAIPEVTRHRDEIGDLAASLRHMTDALNARITAIERFAADVSHEIKNPLSSLASAVETVSKLKDPERIARLMEIIQHDVQRLDRLITDISSASRVDAEMGRIEAEPIDLRHVLQMLVELHGATHDADDADDAAHRLILDLPPDKTPLKVAGIEDRLVQVFQNIIGNALSFSPPGGSVTLSARTLNSGWIEVTIADEGPGIPADKLEAIFDRFYSERPPGESFGTHSGLGLSISRQIVEAHGGTVRARNRTGPDGRITGAAFSIQLPRQSW